MEPSDLTFTNTGRRRRVVPRAHRQHSAAGGSTGPWGYTVEAGKSLSDAWTAQGAAAAYDLSVYGANGFFRKFKGSIGGAPPISRSRASTTTLVAESP